MARSSTRAALPRAAAFWVLAALFLVLFFASSAASPLYGVYQAQFHFSAATLTAVFAVYVLVLLISLLFFGSLSDYLGRVPVIVASLVFSMAACGVFLVAGNVAELFAARALQGIATGLATGPLGAALIDLQPPGSQRAPMVTSAFSSVGLASGSLVTSVLVQYGPAPTRLIWWLLAGAFAGSLVVMAFIAEPGARRPGVLGALKPRVAVPRQARGTYIAVLPSLLAIWALGGLFLSLGPSLAAEATRSANLLPGGLVIFVLFGAGAVAAYTLRGVGSRAGLLAGCALLVAGMALMITAIVTTSAAALYLGIAVAGTGFGLVSLGSFRMVPARAEPGQRAGVVAAIYIAGYLAFSIPALVAGVTTTRYGLHPTALVYAVAVAVLSAAAGGLLLFRPDDDRRHRDSAGPAAGTTEPARALGAPQPGPHGVREAGPRRLPGAD